MRVLVTGGGGFLGKAIVQKMQMQGHTLTVVARGNYPWMSTAGIRLCRGDLAEKTSVQEAFQGQDLVIHSAAKAGVWGPHQDYVRSNVEATHNVLALCREHHIPRLLYTSSPSVVFDEQDHENALNDLPYPKTFLTSYSQTKATAEQAVLAANTSDFATVALRPHLIWGPEDPHLLPRLFARARQGRLRRVGDGQNKVSLSYIDNAAAAHLCAAARLEPGVPWAGQAYFVNDAAPVVLWDWLNMMLNRVGIPEIKSGVSVGMAMGIGGFLESSFRFFGIQQEPPLTRFVAAQLARSHWYSLAPAQAAFGYVPVIDPEEAVSRTVTWWRAHPEMMT